MTRMNSMHSCGPEVLFETCADMKFVDDDDATASLELLPSAVLLL